MVAKSGSGTNSIIAYNLVSKGEGMGSMDIREGMALFSK